MNAIRVSMVLLASVSMIVASVRTTMADEYVPVSGLVTDLHTGRPIEDARVSIRYGYGRSVEARTDRRGRFGALVAGGHVVVLFTPRGFLMQSGICSVPAGASLQVEADLETVDAFYRGSVTTPPDSQRYRRNPARFRCRVVETVDRYTVFPSARF